MPEVFMPTELYFGREYAQASRDMTESQVAEAPVLSRGPNYVIDLRANVPPGASILNLEGSFFSSAGAASQVAAWGSRGGQGYPSTTEQFPHWVMLTGPPGVNPQEANDNTVLFCDWDRIALIRGDAAGVLDAAQEPPQVFRGQVTYEFPRTMVGLFSNAAVETPPNASQVTQQVLRALQRQGEGRVVVGVRNDGRTPAVVHGCAGAYPRGDQNYFVIAADLGNGQGQLDPLTTVNNTAARFNNHPGIFIPKGGQVRGARLPARFPTAQNAITNPPDQCGDDDSGVRIYTVDRAPLYSEWRFQVDSEPIQVVIKHPDGSDFRKPIDIWNQVIEPFVSDPAAEIATYQRQDNGLSVPPAYFQTGTMRGSRYTESAIFVDAWDEDPTPIYTLVPQEPIT